MRNARMLSLLEFRGNLQMVKRPDLIRFVSWMEQRSSSAPLSTFSSLHSYFSSSAFLISTVLLCCFLSSLCCKNHPHNYGFWAAPWVNMHIPPCWCSPTSLPQPRQDNLRLLSAPLAKAEELVSCTASFVEKLHAAGLQ